MISRGFAALVLVLAGTAAAQAHHPGSHASRETSGRVKLEVVATMGETCLAVGALRAGTPPGVAAPPGAAPFTAQVERTAGGCRAAATAIRAERLIELGTDVRQIHLFVLGPDGAVVSTERVPLR